MAAFTRKYGIYLFSDDSRKSINPLSICFSTKSACVFDYLIHKYHFSPQTVTRVASVFACRRISKRSDSVVLSFLKENGFSNTQLENVVKYEPRLLSSSLERTVKPKIKIFQDMGFSATDIAEIFGKDPSIFHRNTSRCIVPTLGVYRMLLGSNAQVAKLLRKPGWWSLFVDVKKTLLPNIELLKSCGVPMEHVNSFVYTSPYLFFVNPKKMKKTVDKVEEMGVVRTSKLFIHAVRVVGSIPDVTWKLKMQMFKDLGFSEDDISRMLRSAPIALTISRQRIENVTKVILDTGKYDMSCIIKWPASLMYSVEKRFKPRLQVLRVLDKKEVIHKWPGLSTLCSMTDDEFFRKFVTSNMKEVGKELIAKTAVTAKGEAETCS